MSRNIKTVVTLMSAALSAGTFAFAATAAGDKAASSAPAPASSAPASSAFERVKSLAGEWVSAEDGQMIKKGDLAARYAVTAGGTAVVETIFPGSPHEMVTVYHKDGRDLVLTHYCVEGNQPRLRATMAEGSRLDFAYDGGANIDPKHDRHMHSAWLDFVSSDEIRSEWTELAEGKSVLVAQVHLVRKGR